MLEINVKCKKSAFYSQMHMCSNNSEKENRQHQIQIHKNMEKNIVYQLVENTVTLQKLKEELFHLVCINFLLIISQIHSI